MFQPFNQDLPQVEERILKMLGPRDLISAMQVCKDWEEAVRRFTGRLEGLKKCYFWDSLSEVSFDSVKIYATLKTPMRVRELTINKSKEVYIIGEKRIIQLDPINLQTQRSVNVNDTSLCELQNDIVNAVDLSPTKKMQKAYLGRLKEKLCFDDVIQISKGLCIFSVVDKKSKHRRASNLFLAERDDLFHKLNCPEHEIRPRLLANIPMRRLRLRMVGTRIFCFSNGAEMGSGLRKRVMVLDIWNPATTLRSNLRAKTF